jgi:Xaa-Pro aminopeptidase
MRVTVLRISPRSAPIVALLTFSLQTLPMAAQVGPAPITQAEHATRRTALLAGIDSGIVIANGGREPTAHYPAFIQIPAFRYLTGHLDPDASLVLVRTKRGTTGTLLVPPTDPAGTLFTGRTTDLAQLSKETGLKARYVEGLLPLLDSLARTGLPLYVVGDFVSNEFAGDDSLSFTHALVRQLRARVPSLDVRDATPLIDALRARKSAAEIAILTKAAGVSSDGHRAALKAIASGRAEFEVQAAMESTFRREGADGVSYASIVGSGPNSTTLHYDAGGRIMRNGEVVLMDVAAAWSGYAADITRTVPVNGKFTPAQREIYQLVLDVQKVKERTVKVGASKATVNDSVYGALKAGLATLGLIESPDAMYDAPPGVCGGRRGDGGGCPQWYLYSYHGYSHGLGLDVHDLTQAGTTYQSGDVFTIEPGIYVRQHALDELPDTPRNRSLIAHAKAAVARYTNIGVRIEDDYVLTPTGLERISTAPREIAEIEAAMAKGASAGSAEVVRESDRADVLATVARTFKAMAAHDSTALRQLLAPTAIFHVSPAVADTSNPRRSTAEEFIMRISTSPQAYLERIWDPTVLVHGPIASVWAPYDFHIDGKFSHCGVDTFTLVRQQSGWKITDITYTVEREGCTPSPLGPPQ